MPGAFLLIFGVILPAFTLIFEVVSGMCSALSFDPIPSVFHILLVACVPVANAAAWTAVRKRDLRHLQALALVNGFAIGISSCYVLVFLPLFPPAVLALVGFGIGLIPLSPLLSLFAALVLRRRMKQLSDSAANTRFPRPWKSIAAATALLLLCTTPQITTHLGTRLAVRDDTRADGIRLLRKYGNRNELLKMCFQKERYLSPRNLAYIFFDSAHITAPWFLQEIKHTQARRLFYRVTGTPYNAVKPPNIRAFRGGGIRTMVDANDFDFDQGGDAVASRIRGLRLSQSSIDVAVDTDSAISYTEWTLVFRNESNVQREARAQVALPPGGVVSRLTLWIDGKEHEAAYSERGKVKDAYKKIVQRRRDPVLVTTSGRDAVMVQCFPVPPRGGTMKVRIGITAPLILESREQAALRLPYFIERNFDISSGGLHPLHVQSESRMIPRGKQRLKKTDITSPFCLRFMRSREAASAWTEDHHGEGVICQSIIETPVKAPSRAVIVIDASRRMAEHREDIRGFLTALPEELDYTVLLAGDDVVELGKDTGHGMTNLVFTGGCDSLPALEKAYGIAHGPGDAIVWLHSAQPVELSSTNTLARKLSGQAPAVYRLQMVPGPNVVARQLDESESVRPVPYSGNAGADLDRLLTLISGKGTELGFERNYVNSAKDRPAGIHTSSHLARLWAYDEILRLAGSGTTPARTNAVRLAADYQLVTPVSGAVVLETEKQYKEAGLSPVDANSVPVVAAVPEPGTWALMLIGFMAMFLVRARKEEAAAKRSNP